MDTRCRLNYSQEYQIPNSLKRCAEEMICVRLGAGEEKAGFITGENICIDGGMTKLMIYHDDHGWTYTPEE